jgi:hypothetical protein
VSPCTWLSRRWTIPEIWDAEKLSKGNTFTLYRHWWDKNTEYWDLKVWNVVCLEPKYEVGHWSVCVASRGLPRGQWGSAKLTRTSERIAQEIGSSAEIKMLERAGDRLLCWTHSLVFHIQDDNCQRSPGQMQNTNVIKTIIQKTTYSSRKEWKWIRKWKSRYEFLPRYERRTIRDPIIPTSVFECSRTGYSFPRPAFLSCTLELEDSLFFFNYFSLRSGTGSRGLIQEKTKENKKARNRRVRPWSTERQNMRSYFSPSAFS